MGDKNPIPLGPKGPCLIIVICFATGWGVLGYGLVDWLVIR